jgi:DNA-binding transcriptional regulator YbjK
MSHAAPAPDATPAPLSPRRRLLLDAALHVIADQGLKGLTHRAVDRQAGLPEGSCSAYWRTRNALQAALTEYVAASLLADVDELTQLLADHRARLISIVEEIMTAGGKEHGEARAEALVASYDGILLAALLQPAPARRDFLHRSLEVLGTALAGNAE